MTNIYDYNRNIKVATTPNGDKIITMNEAIFTALKNRLFDAADYHRIKGYNEIADDTIKMWDSLNKTEE